MSAGKAGRFTAPIGEETRLMAAPVPAGSDVSSGTYSCTACGYDLDVGSTKHLPPCPKCGNGMYNTRSGGDSVSDPYPKRDSTQQSTARTS
jgi:predicted RNA-binding Zn-ribbon protein involved in translation (DUF1610 family)